MWPDYTKGPLAASDNMMDWYHVKETDIPIMKECGVQIQHSNF